LETMATKPVTDVMFIQLWGMSKLVSNCMN
jgi:hypothetical protein